MAKKAPEAAQTSEELRARKRSVVTKSPTQKTQRSALGRNIPGLNVSMAFEYATVREEDWKDKSLSLIPFANLRASENDVLNMSCYSYGSASRDRSWFTKIGCRQAPSCQDGVMDNFVIVKLVSFR